MHLDRLSPGKAVPDDIHVIIEVPSHGQPIGYDIDQQSGVMEVARFMSTSMHYPCNYGYVPHTACADGSPVAVLVISPFALLVGCVIRCRPIGMLALEDDEGADAKILAVPIDKLTPLYASVQSWQDLAPIELHRIAHFFEHYKDLKPGRWVNSKGWQDRDAARRHIVDAVDAARHAATGGKP